MIFHGFSTSTAPRYTFCAAFALCVSLLSTALTGCIANPKSQHTEFLSTPAQYQQSQISQEPATCVATSNFQSEMLSRVNRIRAAGAVCGTVRYPPAGPLRWSHQLQQAADSHARDMAEHNFFNHKSATNGTTLAERLRSVGYKFQAAGENIGAGPTTVAQAVDMWVASPGHCVTLMTTDFVDLGASCKNNSHSYYKNYWTLKAATPS